MRSRFSASLIVATILGWTFAPLFAGFSILLAYPITAITDRIPGSGNWEQIGTQILMTVLRLPIVAAFLLIPAATLSVPVWLALRRQVPWSARWLRGIFTWLVVPLVMLMIAVPQVVDRARLAQEATTEEAITQLYNRRIETVPGYLEMVTEMTGSSSPAIQETTPVPAFFPFVVGLFALVTGFGQWIVTRKRPDSGHWFAASGVGFAAGAVGGSLFGYLASTLGINGDLNGTPVREYLGLIAGGAISGAATAWIWAQMAPVRYYTNLSPDE